MDSGLISDTKVLTLTSILELGLEFYSGRMTSDLLICIGHVYESR